MLIIFGALSIISKMHHQDESYPFREIAFFVLTLLTMPTSNAVVERAFSVMNAVKTKVRN
jgi:multisubunit Na+/H+ antiporter MnhG subunit